MGVEKKQKLKTHEWNMCVIADFLNAAYALLISRVDNYLTNWKDCLIKNRR